jgi:hypothetical protein
MLFKEFIMGWVVVVLVVIGIGVWISHSNKKDREKVLSKYDFTPEQKEMFLSKKLWVGMPADALYVVLGYGKENKTTGAGGEHVQHVYENEKEYHYVYTENGVVTSWQSGR